MARNNNRLVINETFRMSRKNKNKNKNNKNDNNSDRRMFKVVTVPISTGAVARRQPPRIAAKGDSMVIHNTEPFFTVTSGASAAFIVANSAIIPVNFTWLNGLTGNYSRWRWLSLELFYVPSVSTFTTGEHVCGFQYDRGDTVPTTFAQVQQLNHSVTSPVWAGSSSSASFFSEVNNPGSVHLTLDVAKFNGLFYRIIPNATLIGLSAQDQNIYVPATFISGNQGNTNPLSVMGRWYGKYAVELIEPIPPVLNA